MNIEKFTTTCLIATGLSGLFYSCELKIGDKDRVSYKDCYQAYTAEDYQLALALINQMHLAVEGSSNRAIIQEAANGYYLKAYVFKKLFHPDSALYAFYDAINVNKQLKNNVQVGHLTMRIGTLFYENRAFDKALKYYQKAYELSEKNENEELRSMSLANLGICSRKIGREVEAIHYLNNAIGLAKELENSKHLVQLYLEKGMCFYQTNDWSRARENFFKSLGLAKRIDNDDLTARNLTNIASTYLNENVVESARTYLSQAREMNATDSRHLARVYVNYGNYHNMKQEYNEAIRYYELAMDHGASMVGVEEANHAYDSLTTYFMRNEDFKSALTYSLKLNKLNSYVSKQRTKLNRSEKNFGLILAENVLEIEDMKEARSWKTLKFWSFMTLANLCLILAIVGLKFRIKRNRRIKDPDEYYASLEKNLLEHQRLNKQWMERIKKEMH